MKIQLRGQSVRVRIDEDELRRLQAGETVENATRVAGRWHRQVLRTGPGDEPRLHPLADGWALDIPADLLAGHAARLPCREGIPFSFAEAGEPPLRMDVEVDVRDSARARSAKRGHGGRGIPEAP